MRLLIDNTEYPYYGKFQPPFEVGTHKQLGTRKARLFQGFALQGCGITLFSEFRLLRYKQYRSKRIGVGAKWLKFQGFNLSYALMDREFYRAALVKELKSQNLPVLMPAKRFNSVKRVFSDFLLGKRPIFDKYLFSQKTGTKPWLSSVHMQLVLIAHKNQSALEIRQKLLQNKINFNQAMEELEDSSQHSVHIRILPVGADGSQKRIKNGGLKKLVLECLIKSIYLTEIISQPRNLLNSIFVPIFLIVGSITESNNCD
ncbi:hypothetical protein [Candidatus Harpocratesius sp.]